MDQYFRWPGNTGFNASLRRVEGILKNAGYVEEKSAPSGAPLTYRIEHRPMRTPAWEPVDASVTVVGEAAAVLRLATNRNMLAINSYSTPDTGVVAPLVDVGAGTPTDYARQSVAGKIVLADGSVGGMFTEAVVKRGALGVLAYRMPAYTQPEIHRTSIQFGSIAYDTTHRAWAIALSRDAVDRLRARGEERARWCAFAPPSKSYPSDEMTIVAEVHGSAAPSERFVLSAHVQEPGTNDNASGVGDLSEMARVLGELTRTNALRPKRTITMLFGLEIAQTRNFLADDSVRTRGVKWGLSLDMTGEDTKKTGGTFLIEKMPDPSAIWTRGDDHHTEWGGRPLTKADLVPHYYNDFLLARCADQAANTGWVVRANPFEGGSDHTPFLQFKKPGVLFWHFTDVYYHTDGDRLDKVSEQELVNSGHRRARVGADARRRPTAPTARALVGEVERAAIAPLGHRAGAEQTRRSARAVPARRKKTSSARGPTTTSPSLRTMTDIEVGGSSAETNAAIDAAAQRVAKAGGRARSPTLSR